MGHYGDRDEIMTDEHQMDSYAAAAMEMMLRLWAGTSSSKYSVFNGIIPYIDTYVANLNKSDQCYLIECHYNCFKHAKNRMVYVSQCEAFKICKEYQRVLSISYEDLEILLNNIILKFDNILIENNVQQDV